MARPVPTDSFSPESRRARPGRTLVRKLLPFSGIAVLVVLWDLALSIGGGPKLLPRPLAVFRAIGELGEHGFLVKHVVASLFRVTWGYVAAVLVGIPLGIVLGWYRHGGMAIAPLLEILRPISPLAWIPLAILWFGVGDVSAVFIIFLASLFPLTLTAMNAVRGVELVHVTHHRRQERRQPLRSRRRGDGPDRRHRDRSRRDDAQPRAVEGPGMGIHHRPRLCPPMTPTTGVKVRIQGLSKAFHTNGHEILVLENIDLDVRDGELVCILGPSGCGKSTLLNIVGGFLPASSGDVTIDGSPVREPDPRRIFVFQERGVFPWLTVEGNIGFGISGLPSKEKAARIAHYVRLVGLEGFESAYPQELSGGMKQRVEVARALAVNPDVLYLDEPFGALDSITRHVMRSELLRIWEAEKKTILFVTHDIEESCQLADRVVVLSARPGSIRRVVDVDLPHPRDLSSPRYLALRDSILEEIGLAHRI